MLVATRMILLPDVRRQVRDDGLAILPMEIWKMIIMHVGGDHLSFNTKKKIHAHAMNDKTMFTEDMKTFLRECIGLEL